MEQVVGRSDPKIVKVADEHLKFGRLDWGKDPAATVTIQGVGLGGPPSRARWSTGTLGRRRKIEEGVQSGRRIFSWREVGRWQKWRVWKGHLGEGELQTSWGSRKITPAVAQCFLGE